jgi:hypothetical protein
MALDNNGKIAWSEIAADEFGNALGSAIVGAFQQTPGENKQQQAQQQAKAPQSVEIPLGGGLLGMMGAEGALKIPLDANGEIDWSKLKLDSLAEKVPAGEASANDVLAPAAGSVLPELLGTAAGAVPPTVAAGAMFNVLLGNYQGLAQGDGAGGLFFPTPLSFNGISGQEGELVPTDEQAYRGYLASGGNGALSKLDWISLGRPNPGQEPTPLLSAGGVRPPFCGNLPPESLVLPGEVAATPLEQEGLIQDYLQSIYGQGNVGAQVRLKVTYADGGFDVIKPDSLIRMPDGSYSIADAKLSYTKDLCIADLPDTFSRNQKPAFEAIADGSATVQIANSQAGRAFFGRDFQVGRTIVVNPEIDVYVNTPLGQFLRHYP